METLDQFCERHCSHKITGDVAEYRSSCGSRVDCELEWRQENRAHLPPRNPGGKHESLTEGVERTKRDWR